MKEQHGFIFIVTLCITTVMSLLLLSSLQNLLLYQRAANQQEEEAQRFYQLEHTAKHLIDASLKKLTPCIVQRKSSSEMSQYLQLMRECSLSIGATHYQYLIEDLGIYPCLVSWYQETLRSTHHFRFTVLALPDERYSSPSFVQIRVLHPASSLSCDKELKYVALGISSWRYFENMDLLSYNT